HHDNEGRAPSDRTEGSETASRISARKEPELYIVDTAGRLLQYRIANDLRLHGQVADSGAHRHPPADERHDGSRGGAIERAESAVRRLLQVDDGGVSQKRGLGFGLVAHARKEEGHGRCSWRKENVAVKRENGRDASAEPAKNTAAAAASTTAAASLRLSLTRSRTAKLIEEASTTFLASDWPRLRLAEFDLVGGAVGVGHHHRIALPIPLCSVGAPAVGLDGKHLVRPEGDNGPIDQGPSRRF